MRPGNAPYSTFVTMGCGCQYLCSRIGRCWRV
jgi:hypothetical protein